MASDDESKRRAAVQGFADGMRIPLDRLVPPSSPPAAVRRRETSPEALAERRVLALESIAASLEKLANPPVAVQLEPPRPELDE
jgi:hypothetical protein